LTATGEAARLAATLSGQHIVPMAWRVIEIGTDTWNVSIAAERRANSDQWALVLSFRSAGPAPRRFWIPHPIYANSKAALYSQAEQLSDHDLKEIVTERLSNG
jgi:hypothetical protein